MHRRLWNRVAGCWLLAARFWQILDPETISDGFRALQAASDQQSLASDQKPEAYKASVWLKTAKTYRNLNDNRNAEDIRSHSDS